MIRATLTASFEHALKRKDLEPQQVDFWIYMAQNQVQLVQTYWQFSAKALIDYIKSKDANEYCLQKLCVLFSILLTKNVGVSAIKANDFELIQACFEQAIKPKLKNLIEEPESQALAQAKRFTNLKITVVYFLKSLSVLFN